jgi:hypothetical protein
MSTEAAIAAGRELYDRCGHGLIPWNSLTNEGRDVWIADALATVQAYEQAVWRELGVLTPEETKPYASRQEPTS